MHVGLTLGKFAPLHKGHQWMIETALAEVDHLIVLVYDAPDVTTVPLPVRAGWIRALYPQVEVLEAWDGPMVVGDTPDIQRQHEDYVRALIGHRTVTHFYAGEFYGAHMSRALGALDRRIDRGVVPVSGTAIRRDPYAHRAWLDPLVYRDLIIRVVFLGAPATGKSTLAEHLATQHRTVWMPEYGRAYWLEHQVNRRLTPEQLTEIAEGHVAREEALLREANRYLFVDTDATTTYMFALDYHGAAAPRLAERAEAARTRYDLFFLCEADIPYEDTWERSGAVYRRVFQEQTRADLLRRCIPFISLFGTVEQRLDRVNQVLEGFERYRSVANHLLHLEGAG
jgi:NadR type nicotinamide-nucleotide adenylyltransferase